MEPINASPAAVDYAARPRPVTAPKPPSDAAPFSSRQDGPPNRINNNGDTGQYLQAKPPEVRLRETDEQVTRQRVQDMARGTMFDLRA